MDSLVTVSAAASSTSVIELATVKDELNIVGTSYDSRLAMLIAIAGQFIEGPYGLRRPPWRQTYIEKLPGYGGLTLPLARFPIESISEITDGGAVIDGTEYEIAGDTRSLVYRENGWSRTLSRDGLAGDGILNRPLQYQATYIAGWKMPGESLTGSQVGLPESIQEVALLLVIDWFRGGHETPSGIRYESIDGHQISYTDSEFSAMTKACAQFLARYR